MNTLNIDERAFQSNCFELKENFERCKTLCKAEDFADSDKPSKQKQLYESLLPLALTAKHNIKKRPDFIDPDMTSINDEVRRRNREKQASAMDESLKRTFKSVKEENVTADDMEYLDSIRERWYILQ